MSEVKLCIECNKLLIESGLRIENRGGQPCWMPTVSAEKFIRASWSTTPNTEIARGCGVSEATLAKWAKRVGLPSKKVSYKHLHVEWVKLYEVDKVSIREIANQYSVSKFTVGKALKLNDVVLREPGGWSTRRKK